MLSVHVSVDFPHVLDLQAARSISKMMCLISADLGMTHQNLDQIRPGRCVFLDQSGFSGD